MHVVRDGGRGRDETRSTENRVPSPVVHNARRRCDGGAQRDEEEEEPSHLREGIDG